MITEHGQPSTYLLDVSDYEFMCQRMALLEGIAKGEQDIQQGNVLSNDQARARMTKWLK